MVTKTQKNSGLFSSSDYKISTLTIVASDGNSIDVRNIMIELDIYEDIFSPTMTGSLVVSDAGDIISSFGMHGNEYLLLEVDKPSLNKPIKKIFRIYKIANRDFNTASLQSYTLHFCSEELILSTQSLVSKSYKGLTIDKMVMDILKNRLKVNPDKLKDGIFSTTTGNFNLIVPRMQPLEAIEWLVPRAYNQNENLFFFYENRDGFNFTSYENLIKNPSYAKYSRSVVLEREPSKNFNSINYINVAQDFDIIKSMRFGAYTSTLLSLDLVNRKFSSKTYGYKDLNDKALLNKQAPINNLKNRLGFSALDSHSSMIKYVATSDSDTTSNPANIQNWMPQTSSRLAQINTFKVIITIPGDVLMKVGNIVDLIIPKMQIQEKKVVNDELRTGRYLVSSVHHKFIGDIMTTIIELLSDSVNAALPASADTDPSIQKIIKT